MNTPSDNVEKPFAARLGSLFGSLRTLMLHAAASSDEGTVRATLAYVALWLLAAVSAVAYVTHLSALFR